ncbi:MAG: PQQ-binding-like beta-propeller repeat protein [Victivallales bacterium]|nr:PQQ-binding-like beta-propeller repeat protein [Victivallales bacterium]
MILDVAVVRDGLCAHLGAGDGQLTAALASTGSLLVHGLSAEAEATKRARASITRAGLYGVAWVEQMRPERLPYSENLVNLIVADDYLRYPTPPSEMLRVLRPGGVVYIGQSAQRAAESTTRLTAGTLRGLLDAAGIAGYEIRTDGGGVWARFVKPWPDGMDGWPEPRHGPDGNPVSKDTMVGPPRRIRWVTGPFQEISNQISANGRNFYGGVYARDAFNGLPLWSRELSPSPLRGYRGQHGAYGAAQMIANGDTLFVVTDGALHALDARTGKTLRTYPQAGEPQELHYADGLLLVADPIWVRAVDAKTGSLLWRHPAAQPSGLTVGEGSVFFLKGNARRGDARTLVRLDLRTGRARWAKRAPQWRGQPMEYGWLPQAGHCTYADGVLCFEVSKFSDFREGSMICAVSAKDGAFLWSHKFLPSGHYSQARVVYAKGLAWVSNGRKAEGLDLRTGEVRQTFKAGSGHCFPPVATQRYFLAGEMSFTDLTTGKTDTNRITKGACDRYAGFMPANGLTYVAPKWCVCWPMVKGFVAMAPARSEPVAAGPPAASFEQGPAHVAPPEPGAVPTDYSAEDWPMYRHDPTRSGGTATATPPNLEIAWEVSLGSRPESHLLEDWRMNVLVKGPVTPPVVAGGKVFVARPEAHEVVAIDAATGGIVWRKTANGRIDTAPTAYGGLCLFGTRSGWVYCLRAEDGEQVWRRRAAPNEERIVAFGQVESPWPVPGSVLVSEGIAFFAAGRQYLADGGIRVMAVNPWTGAQIAEKTITDIAPDYHYYRAGGMEFDALDLLVREGDCVTLSRWKLNLKTGATEPCPKSGFGFYKTGTRSVAAPRGSWTYNPRTARRQPTRAKMRPLVVFRDNVLIGVDDAMRQVFRRDFALEEGEKFDDEWFNYRAVEVPKEGADLSRTKRLMRQTTWVSPVYTDQAKGQSAQALTLAGGTVFVAGKKGGLRAFSASDGKLLAERDLPTPVWDGMAAANQQLFVATLDGRVLCLRKSAAE